ncbi:hypothetical protein Syun_028537 [Stephania yunnanensis]|uniref:Nucleolar complex protein 2 homolog n=1 Tax=Stephania yunnanensis TaxID=152371 RepID=A0AAP0EHK1_9MAGN
MGKLGKKARKFAKKNLQSVHKRRRKVNSMMKRKLFSRDRGDVVGDQVEKTLVKFSRRESVIALEDLSLDYIFNEDANEAIGVGSESDGYLSEDSHYSDFAGIEEKSDEGKNGHSLYKQNKEIHVKLTEQKIKLDQLTEKEPEFTKFLESHNNFCWQIRGEGALSDVESELSDVDIVAAKKDNSNRINGRALTNSSIDFWCEQNFCVLPNLLNAYRTACHYGSDGGINGASSDMILNTGVLSKVIMFVLHEASGIFQRLLGISGSSSKVEMMLDLKKNSKWQTVRPLVKSFLRSSLHLLNHVTDSEILVFTLNQLRAAIIFYSGFPSLMQRFIEVAVHLWSTGEGMVSSSSFAIIRNIALLSNLDYYDTLLIKAYRSFFSCCKFVEPRNLARAKVFADSVVELYSLDVAKSSSKVLASTRQLAKILQQGLKTKNKEVLKRIDNWHYVNCIDIWVKYISSNSSDHDLQPLLYLIIQVINGLANLFPGFRYVPLRLKCIQMLNQLGTSTGVFIPITSLVLDILEYLRNGKLDARPDGETDLSSMLKVPKHWLKVQGFHEELVLSAIDQLTVHLNQWSYHISFPELATIPLIRLRKFLERITAESLRRPVKRMIDQVEQNVEFIQKGRDELVFSPKDQDNVESFFQVKRSSSTTPFTQYYASVIEKAVSRNALKMTRVLEQDELRRQQSYVNGTSVDTGGDLRKSKFSSTDQINDGRKRKKKRT